MFNLIKDEFDENTDDILKSIKKILEKNNKEKDKEENNKKDSEEE